LRSLYLMKKEGYNKNMISYLEGKIILKKEKYVVLFSNGIGYKIFLSQKNILKIKENEKISFFSFLEVKENALNLYGFLNSEELEFFETVEKIRGVGPKAALEISSIGTLKSLKERILKQDEGLLYGISGIGKKKAMAILFELGEKIKKGASHNKGDVVLESLVNLGFSRQKARETISEIDFEGKTVEEKIKIALKVLAEKGL